MTKVAIKTPTINLDKLLKWCGAVSTGGQAKVVISEGKVKVNGRVETHRSKKITPGDVVELDGKIFEVSGG